MESQTAAKLEKIIQTITKREISKIKASKYKAVALNYPNGAADYSAGVEDGNGNELMFTVSIVPRHGELRLSVSQDPLLVFDKGALTPEQFEEQFDKLRTLAKGLQKQLDLFVKDHMRTLTSASDSE